MKGWLSVAFWLCPITVVILAFVYAQTHLVGTKVERATTASELHGTEFKQDFDKRWAEMGGDPATCSSAGAKHIDDLKKQLANLQKEVVQERRDAKQKVSELNDLIKGMEGKNEDHQ